MGVSKPSPSGAANFTPVLSECTGLPYRSALGSFAIRVIRNLLAADGLYPSGVGEQQARLSTLMGQVSKLGPSFLGIP